MTDAIEELVHAVRTSTGDPTSRHVFADWFEQQGDPARGELVRLQVQRESLPDWDAQAVHLELKERALLTENASRWAPPPIEGVTYGSYAGGFIDNLGFETLSQLDAHGASLQRAIPFRKLTLRWPRLEGRPTLTPIEGLRELHIIGTLMEPDDIAWLAQCPLLETVDTLAIIGSNMNDAAITKLATSPYLKQLRTLRLARHNFTREGMEAFMNNADLPALRDLDLSLITADELGSGGRYEPTFDEATAVAISQWSVLSQLTSLDMTGHQIGPNGLRALVSSKHVAGLKRLRLKSMSEYDFENDTDVADVFVGIESANPDMRLDELDLSENPQLSSAEIALFANHPAFQQLKVLHVNYGSGNITPILKQCRRTLRILNADNPTGAAFLDQALKSEPEQLHTVRMARSYGWSQLTEVAALLANAPAVPSLLALHIAGAQFEGEDEVTTLGKITSLPNLVSLQIQDQWGEEEFPFDLSDFVVSPFGQQLVSLYALSAEDKLPPIPRPSLKLGRWDTHEL